MSFLIPPPLGLGRPSQKSKQYRLIMVQNPVRARCCGFGEKDRRPIDPPPILQLFLERPDGTLQNAHDDDSNISLFVVQCDLCSENGEEQRSHVYNPSSAAPASVSPATDSKPTTGTLLSFQDPAPTRSLMGAVVSNAYQLTDHKNEPGIFFIFQDLSVRIEGTFCLKFMFIDLSAGDPLTMSTRVTNHVLSKPFTVYSAKNFPGMTDSTLISQSFAQQGIKISIRKGRRIRHVVDRAYSNSVIVDHHRTIESKKGCQEVDADAEKPSSTSAEASSLATTDSSNSSGSSNSKPNYRRIHISSFLSPS
ncbi:velvet factor-domain-containing protein [Parasitella parasitica]|nr:velvet factor-domain-containing protein [Parasitella parasitica]